MNLSDTSVIESSTLIEETFKFWFTDHQHIRSPFPRYIQSGLKEQTVKKFMLWISGLNEKSKSEINDVEVREKLEEIIFETAAGLVENDDEKLTVYYPFMPRIGDMVFPDKNGTTKADDENVVIARMLVKEDDQVFMKITCESPGSSQ